MTKDGRSPYHPQLTLILSWRHRGLSKAGPVGKEQKFINKNRRSKMSYTCPGPGGRAGLAHRGARETWHPGGRWCLGPQRWEMRQLDLGGCGSRAEVAPTGRDPLSPLMLLHLFVESVCAHTCTRATHVDSLWESVPPFYHVGPGD